VKRNRCASGSIWSVPRRPNLWQIRQNQYGNCILRRLSLGRRSLVGALAFVAAASYLAVQEVELVKPPMQSMSETARNSTPTDAVATTSIGNRVASGDQLMMQVFTWLERRPNVTARLRQRVFLQEQEVVGSGAYWQRGVDRQRSTRWELQTHVGDGFASFVQVLVDGRYLWTDRRHNEERRVTRIDLSALRAGLLGQLPPGAQAEVAQVQATIAQSRGGLSQLVASLQQQFQFEILETTGGDSQRWITLIGHWRQSALEQKWDGLNSETPADSWPEQLPYRVVLKIGRKDLFPYSIDYLAASAGADPSTSGSRSTRTVLAQYEFYQARFDAAIPDRRFTYTPGEDWTDGTQRLIRQLSPNQPPTEDLANLLKRRELRR